MVMLKSAAMIFGAVFIAAGIAGFIGPLAPDGMLFGVFAVNPLHNWVHLITGAIGVSVGFATEQASSIYFKVLGIIYLLVAALGFGIGNQPMLGMAHNTADAGLHLLVALVALYLGFIGMHVWHWRTPHLRH